MNKQKNTDRIIVIIATSLARTQQLFELSLKSVYEQININPLQVYIVDDNPVDKGKKYSNEHKKIKRVIKALREDILRPKFEQFKSQRQAQNIEFDGFFHTSLIQNKRTSGFSGTGAWNSGAFAALRYPKSSFLAFLDDDDEWKPNYLEVLFKSVNESEKSVIDGRLKNIKAVASIAGFLRIERDTAIEIQATEDGFSKESFFVSNPGLQGSNLFIELKTFWTIGGFDESLKSTTDRDLGIRLAEYTRIRPSKKVAFINDILVKHYAYSTNRVTASSDNKKQGLDLFYRKYFHQFSAELQKQSLKRAKKLFNYEVPAAITNPSENICSKRQLNEDIKPFNLIIGTISDNADNLRELIKSFAHLYKEHGECLIDYRFLVLENTNDEYELRPIIDYFIARKNLKIELVENTKNGRSIAENRTYLQQKVYDKGHEVFNNNQISWIIDDDHFFKFDAKDKIHVPNYFKYLSEQKKRPIDAMFGQNSDAPPLPLLNTLRSQLIDFYYNLTYFANCSPNEIFELNNWQKVNIEREEFYYDFSKNNFQHLEYPYYQHFEKRTNIEALKCFLDNTALLSNGVNVFRSLTFDPETLGAITNKSSIYRGGNTVIYNSELLLTPNYTPEKDYNRRSDFNWAIINKYLFNYKLYEIILPLKHNRKQQKTPLTINKEKLQADIKGLIFYRFFKDILSREHWENKTEYKNEIRGYERTRDQTFKKIKINNYRTLNLIDLILDILKNKKLWWYKNEYRTGLMPDVNKNISELEHLQFELGKRDFQQIMQQLEDDMQMNADDINNIIVDIKEIKEQAQINLTER